MHVCFRVLQAVHGPLLQASARAQAADAADVTQLPVALREAAFLESADCYTAMVASPEVTLHACVIVPCCVSCS